MSTNKCSHNPRQGVLLIMLSAAAFGSMAVLAKLAYRASMEPIRLLALRFTLAAVGMWLIWLYHYARGQRALITLKTIVPLVAMGALGYVGQSFSYFTAAERISASATGLLLYTYPILVTLLARVFFRELLTPVKVAALALSAIGTLLVLGIASSMLGTTGSAQGLGTLNLDGVAWGLNAALVYSIYIIAGTRYAAAIHPAFTSAVIITSAACVYLAVGLATGRMLAPITLPALGWAAVIALVCTVLAISMFFAGLKILGPSRASIVSTIEPAVTVSLAALVLRESVTGEQIMGGVLILVAVILLQVVEGRKHTIPSSGRVVVAD